MPNYDYHCNPCDSDFTVDRSMTDVSDVKCEGCGLTDTRRVWTAVCVTSAGSGSKKASDAPAPKSGGHGRCGPSCC